MNHLECMQVEVRNGNLIKGKHGVLFDGGEVININDVSDRVGKRLWHITKMTREEILDGDWDFWDDGEWHEVIDGKMLSKAEGTRLPIWSIGCRKEDGEILATTNSTFYSLEEFECLWLR